MFGYIEGYYGKILCHSDRKRVIDKLKEVGLDTYLLAPKEDPYHRISWQETPPNSYLNNLTELINYGNSSCVDVIPAIAPGLSFSYSQNDIEILKRRVASFIDCGAKKVALLMDDIPLERPKNIKYKALGTLHGELLLELNSAFFSADILFCPTLYTDELLESGSEANSYLYDLHEVIGNGNKIFWTGDKTISKKILRENCSTI